MTSTYYYISFFIVIFLLVAYLILIKIENVPHKASILWSSEIEEDMDIENISTLINEIISKSDLALAEIDNQDDISIEFIDTITEINDLIEQSYQNISDIDIDTNNENINELVKNLQTSTTNIFLELYDLMWFGKFGELYESLTSIVNTINDSWWNYNLDYIEWFLEVLGSIIYYLYYVENIEIFYINPEIQEKVNSISDIEKSLLSDFSKYSPEDINLIILNLEKNIQFIDIYLEKEAHEDQSSEMSEKIILSFDILSNISKNISNIRMIVE